MPDCIFCGEPCLVLTDFHGKCYEEWEFENGKPRVVGLIVDERSAKREISEAIEKAIREAPPFSNVVVSVSQKLDTI